MSKLLLVGNPLWDCLRNVDSDFIKESKLELNKSVFRNNDHAGIETKHVNKFPQKPIYLPGGCAQNTARVYAWVMQNFFNFSSSDNCVCSYLGSVGNDAQAELMRKACINAGVEPIYQVLPGERTGNCTVLVTGPHRTMVTDLAASNMLNIMQAIQERPSLLIDYDFFYVEAFLAAASSPIIETIAEHSHMNKKTFIFTLSSTFIANGLGDSNRFGTMFEAVYHQIDYIFGNSDEAFAYAVGKGWYQESDSARLAEIIHDIVMRLALMRPKHEKRLTVVITQGAEDTLLITSDERQIRLIPVANVDTSLIKDTTGAGDAFAGGFMAGIVNKMCLEECVTLGSRVAGVIIQHLGAFLPEICESEPSTATLTSTTLLPPSYHLETKNLKGSKIVSSPVHSPNSVTMYSE